MYNSPGAGIVTGTIVMWAGTIADIPDGYVICDGNAGTPNLLAKFVEGVATAATDPGTTGSDTTHTHGALGYSCTGAGPYYPASPSAANGNLPPYYDVAFIMKT